MLKLLICVTLFILGSDAAGVSVKPCLWKDKDCILRSAALLLPNFINGIEEFGVHPADPVNVDEVKADSGELKLKFTNLEVRGIAKCKIVDIERPTPDSKLKVVLECPVYVKGHYKAGGKLFVLDVDGEGATEINTDKIHFNIEIGLKTIVKDGKKYYKFTTFDYKYEFLEKVFFKFENLFNGDKTKAEPVEKILDESWKEVAPLGAPLIKAVVNKLVRNVEKLFLAIPAEDIELPA